MLDDVLKIADKYANVEKLLSGIFEEYPDRLSQLLIDLKDMQMSGEQIWAAHEFCDDVTIDFLDCCADRNEEMVNYVNMKCAPKVARRHGEQKTIPKIDGAVKDILDEAAAQGTLKRLDEGAEEVNTFFIALLVAMQASSQFTTNVKINLNTGSGEWGVFAVSLVELLNRDGTPFKTQPQDEIIRMQEVLSERQVLVPDDSGIYDALENDGE
jgi:hypothetical protein